MGTNARAHPAGLADALVDVVDAYSLRVYPAVLEQHAAQSVCSPLGVWLLLAACATGAGAEERAPLEPVLGCSSETAGELLKRFLATPPPALHAAVATWVREIDLTAEFSAWVKELPDQVVAGLMPTQGQADDWAKRNTLELIDRFPIALDGLTRIVLASALATKVSWRDPFEVTAADQHLHGNSPWRGALERMLWDQAPTACVGIFETRAAGIVAVHLAVAVEDLSVVSVSADPHVKRQAVLEAAHEVIAHLRNGSLAPTRCSLFDIPLGSGHSWEIGERKFAARRAGEQRERIGGVALPTWHARGDLDLKRDESFGTLPALDVLQSLIGPQPGDRTQARQAAVASFTRYGFEAAAVTAIGVAAAAMLPPRERGVERVATLQFDHPYGAVAITGKAEHAGLAKSAAGFAGLPVFAAWIATPDEPEDRG